MIRVGALGSRGRMGGWVCSLLEGEYADRATLAARADRGGELAPLLSVDAVVDFSTPDGSARLAEAALQARGPLPVFVVGTTGWRPEQKEILDRLAALTPVLVSSNFSMGVLALQRILKSHASLLARLGYSPVLVETHHRHKKDAPSGTALLLAGAVEGETRAAVPIHSIRAGEIVGDHELTFYGPADRLVLAHSAQDRSVFARGALDAALWLHGARARLAGIRQPLSMELYFSEMTR